VSLKKHKHSKKQPPLKTNRLIPVTKFIAFPLTGHKNSATTPSMPRIILFALVIVVGFILMPINTPPKKKSKLFNGHVYIRHWAESVFTGLSTKKDTYANVASMAKEIK
jgi:hypothetical protein